jgi:hypothetical protein
MLCWNGKHGGWCSVASSCSWAQNKTTRRPSRPANFREHVVCGSGTASTTAKHAQATLHPHHVCSHGLWVAANQEQAHLLLRSPAFGAGTGAKGRKTLLGGTQPTDAVFCRAEGRTTIAPQPKAPPSFWLVYVYVDCVSPKGVLVVDVELRGAAGGRPRHSSSNTQAASRLRQRACSFDADTSGDLYFALGGWAFLPPLPLGHQAHVWGIVP